MNIYPPDLTPGDLAILNNLVIVTDTAGILISVIAGIVLMTSMKTVPKLMLFSSLWYTAYYVINWWA